MDRLSNKPERLPSHEIRVKSKPITNVSEFLEKKKKIPVKQSKKYFHQYLTEMNNFVKRKSRTVELKKKKDVSSLENNNYTRKNVNNWKKDNQNKYISNGQARSPGVRVIHPKKLVNTRSIKKPKSNKENHVMKLIKSKSECLSENKFGYTKPRVLSRVDKTRKQRGLDCIKLTRSPNSQISITQNPISEQYKNSSKNFDKDTLEFYSQYVTSPHTTRDQTPLRYETMKSRRQDSFNCSESNGGRLPVKLALTDFHSCKASDVQKQVFRYKLEGTSITTILKH